MPENLVRHISPAAVVWDGSLILKTEGGVTFRSTQSTADVLKDASGTTPHSKVTTGKMASAEVALTDMDLDTLDIFPGIKKEGTTAFAAVATNTVGRDLRQDAKELIIKPIEDGEISTDDTEWITIFKALPPIESFELGFNKESQRVWAATFEGVPDDAVGNENKMFKIGTTIT